MNKSKSIFLYNYSFLSLLNLIKKLIQNKIVPNDIKNYDYQANLFDNTINLKVPEDEKVINDIINHFGVNILNIMFKVFLSNEQYKELIIYYFWLYSIKYKNKVVYMRNLKVVNKALKISKYVGKEAHRLKGFLRFSELENNVLYAEMAPENNIIIFLSMHFKKRLKNEFWIIKDVKREILSVYNKKNYFFINENEYKLLTKNVSNEEKNIQNLWKTFYKNISINERKNTRCQMNFMPKKYWQYITEMRDDNEENYK